MRTALLWRAWSYLYYAGDFLFSLVLQPVDETLEGDFLCTFLVLPVGGRWRGGREGRGRRGRRGVCRWRSRRRGCLFGEGSGRKAPVLGWRSAGDAGVWLTLEGELLLRHSKGRSDSGSSKKLMEASRG